MSHRQGDPPVKITREIPLWGLILAVVGIVGQAITLYYGQNRQGELIAQQNDLIRDLTVKVAALSESIQKVNLKNVEFEYKISDLDRRVTVIEASRKP